MGRMWADVPHHGALVDKQGILVAVYAFHRDVASAQQLGRAVTHFELQLGVVAKGGEVMCGESVTQDIRLPRGEAGFVVQEGLESSPVRWTDSFSIRAADALQDAGQWWEDGNVARAAGLAVARCDKNPAVVKPHVAPAQPLHFVGAYAGIEHDSQRSETRAVIECLGGVHQT